MKQTQNLIGKFAVSTAAIAMLLATSGCTKLRARDH